jgi:beta-phosphoglucomutase-like phosphatase (HAD superfamily)
VTRSYLETCAAHCPVPASHRELVAGLVSEGVRCAVVTGTIPQMVTPVLSRAGLDGLLSCLVTADDVARGKPSPDGFLLARSRLGLDEGDAIVVLEDSQAGITAAVRAGMTPIAVRPGLTGAAITVPSLAALADVWTASPGVHADAHHI